MAELDTSDFEAEVKAEGYEVLAKGMDPNETIDDHTHDFDVRLLVTAGEISVTVDGETTTCRAGDRFALAANRVHSEVVGPEGVSYVVGRRNP